MNTSPPPLLPPDITVLERGWLSSNTVVLRGRHQVAVVDTGYWTHADQTLALVEAAAEGVPVERIVNTHLHSDHCGGNAALQDRHPLAITLVPPGQADSARRWDLVALTYEPTGQHCPRFRVDGTVNPGSNVRLGDLEWEVHSAPGHDPHSVVLYEPDSRTLISADALWRDGFGIVFPELEGESAFEEVDQTLALIERLDPAVVIPGHGAVFTDVLQALDRARSRLAAYVARPDRHAAHAAKVLLKFKLLELQQTEWRHFQHWATSTPYFAMVHARWFRTIPIQAWISELLRSLELSGALRRQGDTLLNA